MNVLEAHGIRKWFRGHTVLAGVDLEIAAGELVAVVGENGSGKSTLLRILAGDLRPDRGSVLTCGQAGYCPQAVVLDDALTVDQHIRYFQAAYRIPAAERAEALIARLGYASSRHQPPGTLSGGTRQKLSLTLALLHEPALLLSTSPTRASTGRRTWPSGTWPGSCGARARPSSSSPTWCSSRSVSTGSAI